MDDSGTPPLRKTVRRKFKPAQCDAQKVVAMEKVEVPLSCHRHHGPLYSLPLQCLKAAWRNSDLGGD